MCNIAMRVEGFQGQLCVQGGVPRSDAEAGAQAWQHMLQFFEEARETEGNPQGNLASPFCGWWARNGQPTCVGRVGPVRSFFMRIVRSSP
jgi:hypothetical protein